MNARQITIFCAASDKIDPKYNIAARELVRALHSRGYTLVSGGGAIGTMGAITDESIKVGGRHIAVLPGFMKGLENTGIGQLLWTETMAERKASMRNQTVAAIALPGGIGTLDELVETHVLKKLGKYDGKVMALNLDGFYNPLKALMDHYVNTGMLESKDRDLLLFPESVNEVLEILG